VRAHPHSAGGIKSDAPNPNRRGAATRGEVEIVECTRCCGTENTLIEHGHPHVALLIYLDIPDQAGHLFAIGRLGGIPPEFPGMRVITVRAVTGTYPYRPL